MKHPGYTANSQAVAISEIQNILDADHRIYLHVVRSDFLNSSVTTSYVLNTVFSIGIACRAIPGGDLLHYIPDKIPATVDNAKNLLTKLEWCFCNHCRQRLVEHFLKGDEDLEDLDNPLVTGHVLEKQKQHVEIYRKKLNEWLAQNNLTERLPNNL